MTAPKEEQARAIAELKRRLLDAAQEYNRAHTDWVLVSAMVARAAGTEFTDPRQRARDRWMARVTNELLEAYEDWRSAARKVS